MVVAPPHAVLDRHLLLLIYPTCEYMSPPINNNAEEGEWKKRRREQGKWQSRVRRRERDLA